MKSIALLTTALFLASAPTPDSDTISELSAGFLLAPNAQALMAAEPGQIAPRVQGEAREEIRASTIVAAD